MDPAIGRPPNARFTSGGFRHMSIVMMTMAFPFLLLLVFQPSMFVTTMSTAIHHQQHPQTPIRSLTVQPLPSMPKVLMPYVDPKELASVVLSAADTVARRLDGIEAALKQGGAKLTPGSPEWFAASSSMARPEARNVSRIALIAEEATRIMAHSLSLTKDQIAFGLPTTDIRGTLLGSSCPLEVDFPCQPRKYRAHSGYCNNVQNPRWGNANIKYLRFLPADYFDGVSIPRHSELGEELPSGRDVCITVHLDEDRPHQVATAILAVWAQFLHTDVAFSAQVSSENGSRLKCCQVALDRLHPECFPVQISSQDRFFSKYGITCQDYMRSTMGPRTGCTLGPREQVNQATTFLDASVLYGSSEEECQSLRTFYRGLLKTQQNNGVRKGIMPPLSNNENCKSNGYTKCFSAGDFRVNENAGLAVMQTLWVREHNRLAKQLHFLNPHWTDETIFQETRRIVIAEIQHITYNEYLPVVLGEALMERYDLKLKSSDHYGGYDINVNPGLSNAAATVALRFYATLLPASYDQYDLLNRKVGEKPLSSTFYSPADLYDPQRFEQYLVGLINQRIQSEDEFITEQLTGHWHGNDSGPGMDIVSHIIQQGRDHGVPGYTKWREFCGLPAVQDFDDLQDVMTQESVNRMKSIYKKVVDIDLFTGGIAEVPSKGALLGPTLGCILARQFYHLRRGDRYFYENDIPPSSFTKEQLAEIRKVTLARIICDNSDSIRMVQPLVMYNSDPFLNAFMECADDLFSSINLKQWRTASTNFVIPSNILRESVEGGKRKVDELRSDEFRRFSENIGFVDEKSPQGASAGLLRPKRQAVQIANSSLILQFATQRFVNSFMQDRTKDMESTMNSSVQLQDLMNVLPNVDVSEFVDIPSVFECDEQTLPCDHTSKFRTYTGWCNNLERPNYGKTFTVFQRLIDPQYDDGLSTPRSRGVSGEPLPSPRLVSTTAHNDLNDPHVRYTLMVMQFAQILDHEITFTPIHTGFKGALLDCKSCDSAQMVHPECFPIEVPLDDPYFPPVAPSEGKPRCLALVRSLPGQLTLGAGPRQQINQATAYLDGSIVYGSDVCVARDLRSFSGGRLNSTSRIDGKELLPETNKNLECRSAHGLCFKAGDNRPSEQPGLGSLHTVFLREHNRIVARLAHINPQWDDETLYQNGRRIFSAMFQHITYNEFLPRILGRNIAHKYGLALVSDSYFNDYDPTCNPTVFNEFSSAAFRFGHSLIQPKVRRLDAFFRDLEPLSLRHRFFASDDLYLPNMIDELLRGLATQSMQTLDPFITTAVTNHLFEDRSDKFSGLDLIALNLQRAREHGIGTYAQVRAVCNFTRANRFEDFAGHMTVDSINKLKSIYAHPDDIDLFTGGMLEPSLHGGVVGPTFACIIGRQFELLRRCDRFFYENSNPLIRFTEAQLAEIRKANLARLVCENSDSIDSIQRSIFDLQDSFLNPRVPCQSLPSIDLEAWKARVACTVGPTTINIGSAERVSPCVMCTCTKEGPLCQSLKVSDCSSLASKFSRQAILRDHVCKVQCAYAFRALPEVGSDDGLSIDLI